MERFFEFVVSHPRKILFLFFVLTLFFVTQIPRIPVETDLKKWLPEGHPEVEYNDEIRDRFGLGSNIIFAISNDGPNGIFNSTTLELVEYLTGKVKEIDGVLEGDVISLATQDNIIGTEEGLEVVPFMERVPQSPEAVEALREALHGNDMYYGTLVSKDDKATLIFAEIEGLLEGIHFGKAGYDR